MLYVATYMVVWFFTFFTNFLLCVLWYYTYGIEFHLGEEGIYHAWKLIFLSKCSPSVTCIYKHCFPPTANMSRLNSACYYVDLSIGCFSNSWLEQSLYSDALELFSV